MGIRHFLRFSLRTLLLFSLLLGSVAYVGYCWVPWSLEEVVLTNRVYVGEPTAFFTPDNQAFLYFDKTLRIRDLRSGTIRELPNSEPVLNAGLSHDGTLLVLVHHSGKVEILDYRTLNTLTKITLDSQLVLIFGRFSGLRSLICFAPDDRHVVLLNHNDQQNRAVIVDTTTGAVDQTAVTHVTTIEYSPDGNKIALGNAAGEVHLLEQGSYTLLKALDREPVTKVHFACHGTRLLWADTKSLHVCELDSLKVKDFTECDSRLWGNCSVEDSCLLRKCELISKLNFTSQHYEWYSSCDSNFGTPVFANDGKLVVSVSSDGQCMLLDSITGKRVSSFPLSSIYENVLPIFSPDGNHLALLNVTEIHSTSVRSIALYRKRRDEHWYGLIPSVGLAAVAFLAFVGSFLRDRRRSRT